MKKMHAISFMDWVNSNTCPYVWYDGKWYNMTENAQKTYTTEQVYEAWINSKQHDKKGSLAT